MKSWFEEKNMEMWSTQNEGESFVAERFIITWRKKKYKSMTSISNNVYNDKLDDIVNKYNNTYHRTKKLNSADINSGMYTEYGVRHKDEDPKFWVGDHVTISKYIKQFPKGYNLNWSEEGLVIKKAKNTVL